MPSLTIGGQVRELRLTATDLDQAERQILKAGGRPIMAVLGPAGRPLREVRARVAGVGRVAAHAVERSHPDAARPVLRRRAARSSTCSRRSSRRSSTRASMAAARRRGRPGPRTLRWRGPADRGAPRRPRALCLRRRPRPLGVPRGDVHGAGRRDPGPPPPPGPRARCDGLDRGASPRRRRHAPQGHARGCAHARSARARARARCRGRRPRSRRRRASSRPRRA